VRHYFIIIIIIINEAVSHQVNSMYNW
jgi:hypothetical protein